MPAISSTNNVIGVEFWRQSPCMSYHVKRYTSITFIHNRGQFKQNHQGIIKASTHIKHLRQEPWGRSLHQIQTWRFILVHGRNPGLWSWTCRTKGMTWEMGPSCHDMFLPPNTCSQNCGVLRPSSHWRVWVWNLASTICGYWNICRNQGFSSPCCILKVLNHSATVAELISYWNGVQHQIPKPWASAVDTLPLTLHVFSMFDVEPTASHHRLKHTEISRVEFLHCLTRIQVDMRTSPW